MNVAIKKSRPRRTGFSTHFFDNFVAGVDPTTQAIVPLFNPRTQSWSEHFTWSTDGRTIIGVTPVGRATCKRLDLNDERYPEDDSIQSARSFWVKAGLHPPDDDSRQTTDLV